MQQFAQNIARNSVAAMAAQVAIKIISFGFTVLIVRRLGADAFGQYAAVAAFGTMFLFIGDLGLSPYLVREVARLRDAPDGAARIRQLYGSVLWLRTALSLAAVTLMLVVAWLSGRPLIMIGALAINAVSMVLYALQGTSEAMLAGHERLDIPAGAKVLYQLTFVSLGAAALALGVGYYGLLAATLAAVAVLTFVCARAAFKLAGRPAAPLRGTWLALIRASLPFGVVAFTLGLSYKFDSVLLNIFHGDAVTGYYNAAYSLVFSTVFLSNAINTALYPALTRQTATDPEAAPAVYAKIIGYLLMIGLPIAVGGSFLADRIVPFLYGDGYGPATSALRVVIWAVPLMFASEFLGYAVIIAGRERHVARSVLVSTGLNVALNLALVPRFGLTAAAIMTVLTECVLVAQYLWLLRQHTARVPWGHALGRPAAAALLMGGAVLLLGALPLPLVVAVGAALYAVLLVLLGVIGLAEWRFVRGLRRPHADAGGGRA